MFVWTAVSTYCHLVFREKERRTGGSRNGMGWHLWVMPWAVCLGVFGTAVVDGRLCAQGVNGDSWRVDTVPSAVFALTEEGDEGALSSIVDVVVGPGGVVAVADENLERVVVFSSDGVVVTSFGRVGEGPGEFAVIGSLTSAQQGLFLFDNERQRLAQWTFDGALVEDRRVQRESDGRAIGAVGRFAREGWLVREEDQMRPTQVGRTARDTVGFFRLDDGRVGVELGRVPGTVSGSFVIQGMPGMRHALFSPQPVGVVFGDCLMMGTSDDPGLMVVDSRGLEVGKVTLEVQVSSTREVHRGEWIAATKADLADLHGEIGAEASRTLEAVGSRLPMAPRIPFAHDVVVDALGYIWVQEYRLPEGPGSTEWKVFAGSGTAIAEVALPEGLDVVAISRDSILAIWTNSVGDQEVRSFRLERPEVVERDGLSFLQCGQLGSRWGS